MPPSDGDDGRELRRGQLRHERPRLRPAVRVHLAQPPHRGDGAASSWPECSRSSRGRRPRPPAPSSTRRPSPRSATHSRTRSSRESTALFATGRLWDDGIIDPRDTRTVLTLALSAVHSAARGRNHPTSASGGCDGIDETEMADTSRPLLVAEPGRDRGAGSSRPPASWTSGASAVFSDPDRDARHVRVRRRARCICPESTSAETYLDMDKVLRCRRAHRCRRDPPGLRLPVREPGASRAAVIRGRPHLGRSPARGHRGDGSEGRGQEHGRGGRGAPGARRRAHGIGVRRRGRPSAPSRSATR